jgi:hypothetical protein
MGLDVSGLAVAFETGIERKKKKPTRLIYYLLELVSGEGRVCDADGLDNDIRNRKNKTQEHRVPLYTYLHVLHAPAPTSSPDSTGLRGVLTARSPTC